MPATKWSGNKYEISGNYYNDLVDAVQDPTSGHGHSGAANEGKKVKPLDLDSAIASAFNFVPIVKTATPGHRLIGTEALAKDVRVVENAGKLLIQENTGSEASPVWTTRVQIDIATGNVETFGTLAGDAISKFVSGIGTHSHQSAGAQGGQLDHGLALTGLGDDDHTQYLHLNKASQTILQDILVAAGILLDGVDVSAHKAGDAKAQHDGGVGTHTHASAGAEGGNIAESVITDGTLLARLAAAEVIAGLWEFSHASGLKTDTIVERTAAAGVTVDGLLIKDNVIPDAGYPNALLKDGTRPLTADWDTGGYSIKNFKPDFHKNFLEFYDDFWHSFDTTIHWSTTLVGPVTIAHRGDVENGWLRITAPSGQGNKAAMYAKAKIFTGTFIWESRVSVVVRDALNIFAGLGDDAGTGYSYTANIKLDSRGAGEKWRATSSNGVETATTTNIVTTAGVTYLMRIEATPTQVKYYIDGVLKATHTTNIPTAVMYPYYYAEGWSGGGDTIDVDYVKVIKTR